MKKTALIILLIASSACSREEARVDMTYRVTVETLENDCSDFVAPQNETALVDVVLNADGTMTFANRSYMIPGEAEYPELVILDGEIRHTYTLDTVGGSFAHYLRGSIDDESIDITLTAESRDYRVNEFRRCAEKVRIRGARRMMWDPTVVDGKYRATYRYFGKVCPGEDEVLKDQWNVPLDINPYTEGRYAIVFDEGDIALLFELEMGSDGSVDHNGNLYILAFAGYAELDSKTVGIVTPGLVDLSLTYHDPLDDSGCAYRLDVRGGKYLPDPSLLDGTYRTDVNHVDACSSSEPSTDRFEGMTEVILQDDGNPYLSFGGQRLAVALDDTELYAQYRSDRGIDTLTVSGTLAPPELDFTMTYRYDIGNAYECTDRFSMSAYSRYFIPKDGTGFGMDVEELSVAAGMQKTRRPRTLAEKAFRYEPATGLPDALLPLAGRRGVIRIPKISR